MRHRRLTAAVLTAVSGLAIAGLLAGPANAASTQPDYTQPVYSEPAPTVTSGPNATPVTASPTPTASPSPSTSSSSAALQVSGQISAVDVKKGTVTVTLTIGGKQRDLTLNVGANAKILVNGVAKTLADLPVGATVNIGGNGTSAPTLSADTSKLLNLVGTVASVDPKARTVSVKLPTGVNKTTPVSTDAKITLDGATVGLDGLPVNATVVATGVNSSSGGIITKIEAKRAKAATPTPTASTTPTAAPTPTPSKTATPTPTTSKAATPAPTTSKAVTPTPTTSKAVTVKASATRK